jgi:hypothetical protein
VTRPVHSWGRNGRRVEIRVGSREPLVLQLACDLSASWMASELHIFGYAGMRAYAYRSYYVPIQSHSKHKHSRAHLERTKNRSQLIPVH